METLGTNSMKRNKAIEPTNGYAAVNYEFIISVFMNQVQAKRYIQGSSAKLKIIPVLITPLK